MSKITVPHLGGMDRTPDAANDTSYEIKNLSYDTKKKSWYADRGWLGYVYPYIGTVDGDCYSLGFLPLKAGAKGYVLSEREETTGSLVLEYIDPRGQPVRSETLIQGRHLPTQEDVGTSYVTFGNFCAIFNGYDTPLKYLGDHRLEEFGFQRIPPAPQPLSPASGSMTSGGATGYVYAQAINTSDVTVAFPLQNPIGMGTLTEGDTNAYAYKVSFVTDTGSESPLSASSILASWVSGAGGTAYRYGIVVDRIPVGPDGTVKRRLYRTKNLGDQDVALATWYFVDDIPNNLETVYNDWIPDSQLGSQAPAEFSSGLFPRGVPHAASFQNRIIVAGGSHHPTRIFFSAALAPEQFPTVNFIDCSQRDGQEITGLVPFNNLLVVFRRTAIEALIPTGDPNAPFYLTPIITGIGTVAGKSAQVIPGVGLMFLAQDGFYLIKGNYSGGSHISITRVSDGLGDYITKLNATALARACATYNARDEEYWCQVATDTSPTPNLGFVYHPSLESWSVREEVPAQCFLQLPENWTLFGTNQNLQGLVDGSNIDVTWGVWCGTAGYGYQSSITFPGVPPIWSISSNWMNFGDRDSLKTITSITLYVVATTSTQDDYFAVSIAPEVTAYIDWDYDSVQTNTKVLTTQVQDRPQQTAWDFATIGTDRYENARLSAIAYDFNIPDCRWFRFVAARPAGAIVPIIITGISIEYVETGVQKVWSGAFDAGTGNIPLASGAVPASLLP